MSIRVLDPLVAQQVAAGEVVDRPASVVKELVENALDAGASRIEIELGGGGTSRMLVRDDGSGMNPEDAALSVLRHATSKIGSVADLESVSTLGFRGEALPSVASVSSFSLSTATGEGAGTRVAVEGGAAAEVRAASHPKGSTVVVDRLFYNVPARRAFLKGVRTERAAITEVVTHLAVSHPRVAFKLSEGGAGGELLSLPAATDLRERLARLYGVGEARAFRRVEHEHGPFRLAGYAAPPSLTRTSRSSCQTVSVNGRWASAEGFNRGLDDAYRGTVAAGRYPPVALRIEVDPRAVDVNVHPTKRLVRFSDEGAARRAVADAVKLAIEWREQRPPAHPARNEDRADRAFPTSPDRPAFSPPSALAGLPRAEGGTTRSRKGGERKERSLFEQESPRGYPGRVEPEKVARLPEYKRRIDEASRSLSEAPDRVSEPTGGEIPQAAEVPERGTLPTLEGLTVVGQVGSGYILVEEPGAVWVVDQHVAHERAILDRLGDPERPPTVQPLLVPEVVELSPERAALALENLEELSVYGFEAEPFGPKSVRITSVISTLAAGDVVGAFTQALSAIAGTEAGMGREERLLATIACHSAVKLGDRLARPEMERLMKDWLGSRLPATCPHGRSICYRIPIKEMARKLDRH
ncbi:MAG: DNA mismatch repair endonuclease MutL [Rubrobacter sp.]|nr:DNA mismatch repair endonuclease MutL [Rubrobacter sp.]